MMKQVVDGLWTVPCPLRFGGLAVNTRMTVCRLSDGGLALISPVRSSADLRRSIDSLGPVRAIIAPNLLHHLYAGEWIEAYPEALSYSPPGLSEKRTDLDFDHDLGPAFDKAFHADFLRVPIAGMPKLNESLFLHRRSKTLIVTDFCFFLPEATGPTAIFASVMGIRKRTKCEPLFRILIRDKDSFRASLHTLRSMEIRHLSMCHHKVLSTGADEALQGVLDQLKVPSGCLQADRPYRAR